MKQGIFRLAGLSMALSLLLAGCSAALVPLSFDPKTKLQQAHQLLYELNRPLPAERLISEAYDIYKDRQDSEGMAQASFLYGSFFASHAVGSWSQTYERTGFFDGSSYRDRFRSAAKYFARAADHFAALGQFDALTSARYNMAEAYMKAGETEKACLAYEQSLEAYQQNMAANPGVKVTLPPSYSRYEDLVRDDRKAAGCS